MIARRTHRSLGLMRRTSRRPFLRGNYHRRRSLHGLGDDFSFGGGGIDWSAIVNTGIAAGTALAIAKLNKPKVPIVYAQPPYYMAPPQPIPQQPVAQPAAASILPTSLSSITPGMWIGGGLAVLALVAVASR